MGALSTQLTLDAETRWAAMRSLIDRMFRVLERETVLVDCLDIIVDLLGADRGLVLVADAVGTTRTLLGRRGGQGKSLSVLEREEISKTIIRTALESGQCVKWSFDLGNKSSSSIASLGILAAIAAPLVVPGVGATRAAARAVLYVDVRDPQKHIESSHVDFFMSAALLLGALLDQRATGESDRARLGEALSHTTDARRSPPLEEIIAFEGIGRLRDEIISAIPSELSVLILGESGTGKTLLAQAIAEASTKRPIVRATLGGSDDLNTITSELFGHERGSYSGATGRRVGLVEFADGGTLIFDELLNLPPHAQKLLLDFTQFGTYRPLGYNRPEPKRSSVRIIGATNGNLRAAIRAGRFREDLYQRLAGAVIELPPLRQRRADIPNLAERALRRCSDSTRTWSLSLDARRLLVSKQLEWSGNVRQLERVVLRARERALLRDPEATTLVPEHFEARDLDGVSPALIMGIAPTRATAAADPSDENGEDADAVDVAWQRVQAERARLDEVEEALIRRTLERDSGNVSRAARSLGIARTTFSSRLDVLGIRGPR